MVRRTAAALGVAALSLALAAPPASADSPHPWQPYQGDDAVVPAGEVCAFELGLHVLSDKERYRVVETWPDGSTKREEWTGQLIIEFTNNATGEAVTRNLTGRGDFSYGQDGSWSLTAVGGHFAAGLHQGDSPAPGMYVVSGRGWTVTQDASGTRTLTEGNGTIENLCQTLG